MKLDVIGYKTILQQLWRKMGHELVQAIPDQWMSDMQIIMKPTDNILKVSIQYIFLKIKY